MPIEKKRVAAAIVTIRRAHDMTPRGRSALAKWLRQQARFLEQYGAELGSRFTARYLYR